MDKVLVIVDRALFVYAYCSNMVRIEVEWAYIISLLDTDGNEGSVH